MKFKLGPLTVDGGIGRNAMADSFTQIYASFETVSADLSIGKHLFWIVVGRRTNGN